LVTSQYYFCCKFAIIDKNNAKRVEWERGVDRIVDMELLDDLPQGLEIDDSPENIKKCELNLEWESFFVTFSCSYPIDDSNDQLILTGCKAEIKNI
jgi:hypothetical protein